MDNILPAIIEAVAVIVAALVGTITVRETIKETEHTRYINYANIKDKDLKRILRIAKKSIIVVANCGDTLLKKYKSDFSQYMCKKIKLYYLLLGLDEFERMDIYMTGDNKINYNTMINALEDLRDLKNEFGDMIEIRQSKSIFTHSFISIDLVESGHDNIWPPYAVIQLMSYLYLVPAKDSPITYFTPSNKKSFDLVANSILALWHDADEVVNVDQYLENIKSIISI